jgi:hypothetical protein
VCKLSKYLFEWRQEWIFHYIEKEKKYEIPFKLYNRCIHMWKQSIGKKIDYTHKIWNVGTMGNTVKNPKVNQKKQRFMEKKNLTEYAWHKQCRISYNQHKWSMVLLMSTCKFRKNVFINFAIHQRFSLLQYSFTQSNTNVDQTNKNTWILTWFAFH